MDLLQSVLRASGGDVVRQLAEKFNLNKDEAAAGIASLIPAVAGGVQSKIASDKGCLVSVLASGGHASYADDPDVVTNPNAVIDGMGVLAHLFGEVAHQRVAEQAARQTGISIDKITQMMPLVASLAIGVMSKHLSSGDLKSASVAEQSRGLRQLIGSVLSVRNPGTLRSSALTTVLGPQTKSN